MENYFNQFLHSTKEYTKNAFPIFLYLRRGRKPKKEGKEQEKDKEKQKEQELFLIPDSSVSPSDPPKS